MSVQRNSEVADPLFKQSSECQPLSAVLAKHKMEVLEARLA
jgi:hypothetical protein